MIQFSEFSPELLGVYVVLFLAGISIGSFLNVVIYRLPRNKSIVRPRSFCPSCGKTIPFYLNVPVLSYVLLLGRCSHCGARISPRYLLIELLSGAAVVAYFHIFGPTLQCVAAVVMTLILIPVFFIDLEHRIIPDAISISGIVLGIALSPFSDEPGWIGSLLGILVGGAGFLSIGLLGDYLFKKESLGGGDVKLAAMLGAFLGWEKVLFVFIASAILGLLGAAVMLIFSRKIRESRQIPFGPFLATAGVIALLAGDRLIAFYIDHFVRI
jgi:leader peptidase (prepilin peptidase)/N-methyltransferase